MSVADTRILFSVGYELGRELEDDGTLANLDLAECFELGFLQAIAAAVISPEWARWHFEQVDDWEGWVDAMRDSIRQFPAGHR